MARRSRQLRDQAENAPEEPLITPEARQHGGFEETIEEGPDGTVTEVIKRRGRSALNQWRAAGALSPAQFRMLGEYGRARTIAGRTSNLVSNYDGIRAGTYVAGAADHERIAAISFLKFLEDGPFRYFDKQRLAVFDAVVIHECSTEEAALHFEKKMGSAPDRVRETVAMIADAMLAALRKAA